MRVLVTGIGGFAGVHVAAALLAGGHEVHGVLRSARGRDALAAVGVPPATLHPGDVRDAASMTRLVGEVAPAGIVHLAGVSEIAAAEADPAAAYATNVGGTLALLAAVRAAAPRARLVAVSSGHVYGAVLPDELPVTEDTPLRPLTVYGASKAAAELAAGQWGRTYGIDVVCVRPFNHAGPGQTPAFVCSALARQIALIEAGKQPPVVRAGNLDPVRDLSDVRDIAAGYVALLERGHGGTTYNLSAGTGVSIAEVIAILRTHARVPVRVASDPALRRAGDVPRLVASHARATRDTGWEPRRPLEDTLGATLEDWRRRVADGGK
jgi:GDP-4-dehydro-6-deoxy-D-mannose reductase